ncbi:hypothetical protein [Burkholderia gladioli]|uniref:hypothetical protein n=1 Tax=Burkholderia gladioli TaxID=28095 RepID=UPI000F80E13D|nr:hypothetical protein [Burkholderia gladioli]
MLRPDDNDDTAAGRAQNDRLTSPRDVTLLVVLKPDDSDVTLLLVVLKPDDSDVTLLCRAQSSTTT